MTINEIWNFDFHVNKVGQCFWLRNVVYQFKFIDTDMYTFIKSGKVIRRDTHRINRQNIEPMRFIQRKSLKRN